MNSERTIDAMAALHEELRELIDEQVVVDTKSPCLYIGTLARVNEHTLVLEDVDVHDSGDSSASKELYVIQSLKTGVRANRQSVHVLLREVVSLSRLSDVIEY